MVFPALQRAFLASHLPCSRSGSTAASRRQQVLTPPPPRPPPLSHVPCLPVGAADVGYLTAVSPAAATVFSLVLLHLKSTLSKPVLMILASLLYAALCVFFYASSSAYLQGLRWNISILYALGTAPLPLPHHTPPCVPCFGRRRRSRSVREHEQSRSGRCVSPAQRRSVRIRHRCKRRQRCPRIFSVSAFRQEPHGGHHGCFSGGVSSSAAARAAVKVRARE